MHVAISVQRISWNAQNFKSRYKVLIFTTSRYLKINLRKFSPDNLKRSRGSKNPRQVQQLHLSLGFKTFRPFKPAAVVVKSPPPQSRKAPVAVACFRNIAGSSSDAARRGANESGRGAIRAEFSNFTCLRLGRCLGNGSWIWMTPRCLG